jgi:hypothetical protein
LHAFRFGATSAAKKPPACSIDGSTVSNHRSTWLAFCETTDQQRKTSGCLDHPPTAARRACDKPNNGVRSSR